MKYLIRENPLSESAEELATQVRQISETLTKAIVQAHDNPENGSLIVDLRRENVVDGRVNLPRVPNQTLLRSERYMKDVFAKVKDHPNAEVLEGQINVKNV